MPQLHNRFSEHRLHATLDPAAWAFIGWMALVAGAYLYFMLRSLV
jgi:hypothetical protein